MNFREFIFSATRCIGWREARKGPPRCLQDYPLAALLMNRPIEGALTSVYMLGKPSAAHPKPELSTPIWR
jgi:hypothetical protein